MTLLVQEGVEVIHRRVAHERDCEKHRETDPSRLADEPLHGGQHPCHGCVPPHPPLDDGIYLVPHVEDRDRPDRLAKAEDNRLHGGVELRVRQERHFDGDRKDDGRGNRIEEQAKEVSYFAEGLQPQLERRDAQDDGRPILRREMEADVLKGSSGIPRERREGKPSPFARSSIWPQMDSSFLYCPSPTGAKKTSTTFRGVPPIKMVSLLSAHTAKVVVPTVVAPM